VKLLLELSMECESLARAEAVSAARALGGNPRVLNEGPGVLVLDTSAEPVEFASRLGLCHHVGQWLSSCAPEDIEGCAEKIDVPGPVRVRSTKVGELSVDLASTARKVGAIVGRSRGVDLHRPTSDIRVVYTDKVYFARVLASINRSAFESRKNRYLPFIYPASLHPKFARALVNLAEVPAGGRLLDPFCGTGAIIAEASLVGLRSIGSDFSEKMIAGATRNLAHLRLEAELHLCDVGDISREVGAVSGIATDPPYGRSTSTEGEGIQELYARAFKSFGEVLDRGSRASIVVPDVKLLESADSFRLLETHPLRVHRSLMRNFCVLERV
jgi:tRNA (guanine10-N2)-dimethyltransferase